MFPPAAVRNGGPAGVTVKRTSRAPPNRHARAAPHATGPRITPYVQACIVSVGFPETMAGLLANVGESEDGYGYTDMELLLGTAGPEQQGGTWTAPRWVTEGDILFFYHTKRAAHHVERLARANLDPPGGEWDTVSDRTGMLSLLYDQLDIAERFCGTVFACARMVGPPAFDAAALASKSERHFKSNIFAPIADVFPFEHPLADLEFNRHVTISRGGTITPLHGAAFLGLKDALAQRNRLPAYLADARPGGVSFRDLGPDNWVEIACGAAARFIDESQLRAYLLDYLLAELKDRGTRVYQECRCTRWGRGARLADYLVRLAGHWLPVEAKLNVRAERDLIGQVKHYLGTEVFVPTRGAGAGTAQNASRAAMCLVADAEGLYLVSAEGFVGCDPFEPWWPRTAITGRSLHQIRERLACVLGVR